MKLTCRCLVGKTGKAIIMSESSTDWDFGGCCCGVAFFVLKMLENDVVGVVTPELPPLLMNVSPEKEKIIIMEFKRTSVYKEIYLRAKPYPRAPASRPCWSQSPNLRRKSRWSWRSSRCVWLRRYSSIQRCISPPQIESASPCAFLRVRSWNIEEVSNEVQTQVVSVCQKPTCFNLSRVPSPYRARLRWRWFTCSANASTVSLLNSGSEMFSSQTSK